MSQCQMGSVITSPDTLTAETQLVKTMATIRKLLLLSLMLVTLLVAKGGWAWKTNKRKEVVLAWIILLEGKTCLVTLRWSNGLNCRSLAAYRPCYSEEVLFSVWQEPFQRMSTSRQPLLAGDCKVGSWLTAHRTNLHFLKSQTGSLIKSMFWESLVRKTKCSLHFLMWKSKWLNKPANPKLSVRTPSSLQACHKWIQLHRPNLSSRTLTNLC